ncbi:MAG: hypothetical protein WCB96_05985 [Candidatus Aminicenantales bacterium]
MKKSLVAIAVLVLSQLPSAAWETRLLGLYRGLYQSFRESVFNPQNACVNFLGLQNGPNYVFTQFAGLSFDVLGLDWRVDLSAKAAKSPGGRWETDLTFHQLYLQKDFGGRLSLLAGRSIQRWGTGYAFNPTDVIGPAKELNDPDNNEKRAVGNDLLKIEYFGDSFSLALCGLAPPGGWTKPGSEGWRLAFRAYANIRHVDMSWVALFTSGKSPLWGFNFATTAGDRLEIHGEVGLQRGSYEEYHPASQGEIALYSADPVEQIKKADRRIYLQALLGCTYTFPGNVLWVSEIYHRDQGYSRREWGQVIEYLSFLGSLEGSVPEDVLLANRCWCLQVFSPNGALRDYWMNYLQVPLFKKVSLTATHLWNLSDFGFILIPEAAVAAGDHFTFYLRSYIFHGRTTSEFGSFYQSSAFEAGLRVML